MEQNKNIVQLHENLLKDGWELPDVNTFSKDMEDEEKRRELHKNVMKDGWELPDFETFSSDIGKKKKEEAQSEDYSFGLGEIISPSAPSEPGTPSPSDSPSGTGSTLEERRARQREVERKLQTPMHSARWTQKHQDTEALIEEKRTLDREVRALERQETEERARLRRETFERGDTPEAQAQREEVNVAREEYMEAKSTHDSFLARTRTPVADRSTKYKEVKGSMDAARERLEALEGAKREEIESTVKDLETISTDLMVLFAGGEESNELVQQLQSHVLSPEGRERVEAEAVEAFEDPKEEVIQEKVRQMDDLSAQMETMYMDIGENYTTDEFRRMREYVGGMYGVAQSLGSYLKIGGPGEWGKTYGQQLEDWAKPKSEELLGYSREWQMQMQEELGDFTPAQMLSRDWWDAHGPQLGSSMTVFGTLGLVTGGLGAKAAAAAGLTGLKSGIATGVISSTLSTPLLSAVYGGTAYQQVKDELTAMGYDSDYVEGRARDAGHRTFRTVLPASFLFNAAQMGMAYGVPWRSIGGAATQSGVSLLSGGFDNMWQEGVTRRYAEMGVGRDPTRIIDFSPQGVSDFAAGFVMGVPHIMMGGVSNVARKGVLGRGHMDGYKMHLKPSVVAQLAQSNDPAATEALVRTMGEAGMSRSDQQDIMEATKELSEDKSFRRMDGEAAVVYAKRHQEMQEARRVLRDNPNNEVAKKAVKEHQEAKDELAMDSHVNLTVKIQDGELVALNEHNEPVSREDMSEMEGRHYDRVLNESKPTLELLNKPEDSVYTIHEVDGTSVRFDDAQAFRDAVSEREHAQVTVPSEDKETMAWVQDWASKSTDIHISPVEADVPISTEYGVMSENQMADYLQENESAPYLQGEEMERTKWMGEPMELDAQGVVMYFPTKEVPLHLQGLGEPKVVSRDDVRKSKAVETKTDVYSLTVSREDMAERGLLKTEGVAVAAERAKQEAAPTEALKDVESTAKALESADEGGILSQAKEAKDENRFIQEIETGELRYKKRKGLGFESLIKTVNVKAFSKEKGASKILAEQPVNREVVDAWKDAINEGKRPPIILEKIGENYNVTDGHHKLKAYEELGIQDIPVVYKEDLASIYNILSKSNQEISEAYHTAKADGSNPQLVQAVEKLLGTEAAPKGETREQALRAEGGTVSESFAVSEVDPARAKLRGFLERSWKDMSLTDGQKGQVMKDILEVTTPEQAQRLIDKVLRWDTKRIGEKNRQETRRRLDEAFKGMTKDAWANFKRANQERISELPSRVRQMMQNKAKAMTPANYDTTLQFFENILTNNEYAQQVNRTGEKLEKLSKKRRQKGEILRQIHNIMGSKLRARALTAGEVRVMLDRIDLSNEAMTPEMVTRLEEALDGVMADKPTYQSMVDFVSDYHEVLSRAAESRVTRIKIDEGTVDRIASMTSELERRIKKLRKGMEDGSVSAQDILETQRLMLGLERLRDKFEGDINRLPSEVATNLKTQLESADSFTRGGYNEMTGDAAGAYEAALYQVREQSLKDLRAVTTDDPSINRNLQRAQRDADRILKDDEVGRNAMNHLDPIAMDYVLHSIEELNRSGVMTPEIFNKLDEVHTALKAGYVQTFVEAAAQSKHSFLGVRLFEGRVRDLIKGDKILKSKYAHLIDSFFGIEKEHQKLYAMVAAEYDNVWVAAERGMQADISRILPHANKAMKVSMIQKGIFPELDLGQIKVMDRIGIVAVNLREHAIQRAESHIKEVDGAYTIERMDGEVDSFTTFGEARDAFNQSKDLYVNTDYVGRQIEEGRMDDAKMHQREDRSQQLVDKQMEAYRSLQKDGKPLVIKNLEDAARVLNQDEMKVLKAGYEVFNQHKDDAAEAAHREGRDIDIEGEFFAPFYRRSKEKPTTEIAEGMSKVLDSRINKDGKPLKATDSLLPKGERSNQWVETNFLNMVSRYSREMNITKHALPLLTSEAEAFKRVSNHFKGMNEGLGGFTPKELMKVSDSFASDRMRRWQAQTRTAYFLSPAWGISGNIGGIQYNIDANRGLSRAANAFRVQALVDIMRTVWDGVPQTVRQSWELGGSQFTYGRMKDLASIYSHLPEGSSMWDVMHDNATRFDAAQWGNINKADMQQFTDAYLGFADRLTKQMAWMARFDAHYTHFTGERLNTDRFSNDADYRSEVLASSDFHESSNLADSYVSSVHFARTAGSTRGSVAWNTIDVNTPVYKWVTPLTAYSLQQYQAFIRGTQNTLFGSDLGRDVEARRTAGVLSNGLSYSMMVKTNMFATAWAGAFMAGRKDRQESIEDDLRSLWSIEGVLANSMGTVINLYLSGAASVGQNLANLTSAVLEEGYISQFVDDPVQEREIREMTNHFRRMTGTGFWNMGDMRSGKISYGDAINLPAPVLGGGVADMAANMRSGVQLVSRDPDESVPWDQDTQKREAGRAMAQMVLLASGGYVGSKNVDAILKEWIRHSKQTPFNVEVDRMRKGISWGADVMKGERDILENENLQLTVGGDNKWKARMKGSDDYVEFQWQEEDVDGVKKEYLAVGTGLRGRMERVDPEQVVDTQMTPLIKAAAYLETEMDVPKEVKDRMLLHAYRGRLRGKMPDEELMGASLRKLKGMVDEELEVKDRVSYLGLREGYDRNSQHITSLNTLYDDVSTARFLTFDQKREVFERLVPIYEALERSVWTNSIFITTGSKELEAVDLMLQDLPRQTERDIQRSLYDMRRQVKGLTE